MLSSVNIPTQIATSLEPLAHGLERLLASQPLPVGIESDYNPLREHLTVRKGKSSLSIPVKFAEQLRAQLDPQELAHLFRALPKELCLYFFAARKDYLTGILNDGQFALSRRNSDGLILPLRRICRLGGRDPDSPNQLRTTLRLLHILRELRFTFELNDKEVVVERLVRLPKDNVRYLRGNEIDGGEHRGGTWVCAQIAPELFSLMRHRFIQCPSEAIEELKPRDFNTYLAIKGQAACRKSDEVTLSEKRLIQDAGHSQTTTSGDAREKRLLHKSISKLEQLGYLASALLTNAGNWVLGLKPETLLQPDPETRNPAADSPTEPETLLQVISKIILKQGLMGDLDNLVRNLVRGSSTAQTSLPSVRSGLIESQGVPI